MLENKEVHNLGKSIIDNDKRVTVTIVVNLHKSFYSYTLWYFLSLACNKTFMNDRETIFKTKTEL